MVPLVLEGTGSPLETRTAASPMRHMRMLVCLAAMLVAAAMVLSALAPTLQASLTFEPTKLPHNKGFDTPTLRLDPPARVVWLPTPDGEVLHGWDIPCQHKAHKASARHAHNNQEATTLAFFHGNSRNLQAYTPHIARSLAEGFRVVAFDYRGFGLSTGEAEEQGFYTDVRTIMGYLDATTPGGRSSAILHGYSIGCAAAVYAAVSSDNYGALILEAPFDNFKQAVLMVFPLLAPLASLIHPTFPNAERMADLKRTPLLVVHALDDEVCSFASGVRVFKVAPTPVEHFLEASGGHAGGHCDARAYAWTHKMMGPAAATARVTQTIQLTG